MWMGIKDNVLITKFSNITKIAELLGFLSVFVGFREFIVGIPKV